MVTNERSTAFGIDQWILPIRRWLRTPTGFWYNGNATGHWVQRSHVHHWGRQRKERGVKLSDWERKKRNEMRRVLLTSVTLRTPYHTIPYSTSLQFGTIKMVLQYESYYNNNNNNIIIVYVKKWMNESFVYGSTHEIYCIVQSFYALYIY